MKTIFHKEGLGYLHDNPIFSAEILIALGRFEDAMNVLLETGSQFDDFNFVKTAEFYRYMISEHLDVLKQKISLEPWMVNYDLKAIYRFYGSTDFAGL